MRSVDCAAAEVVGAILLTAIIGAGIAIVGYQWISQVPTASLPYAYIEIACRDSHIAPVKPPIGDFPCRSGIIDCPGESFAACMAKCPDVGTVQHQQCRSLCEESRNCVDTSDYASCNRLSICHNGGDPLLIKEISLIINGVLKGKISQANVYSYEKELNSSYVGNEYYETGEVIFVPLQAGDIPLRSIVITYRDYRSNQVVVLAKKEFGL
jgi:hypothetical protein